MTSTSLLLTFQRSARHCSPTIMGVAGAVAWGTYYCDSRWKQERILMETKSSNNDVSQQHQLFFYDCKRNRRKSTLCEEQQHNPTHICLDGEEESDGYSESERFEQCLAYHRTLYFDYNRRWNNNPDKSQDSSSASTWPRRVPTKNQIHSIEFDYNFCQRGRSTADSKICQDMKFRIACYYVHSDHVEERRRAWKLLKGLAEAGHADGMCYYGMILQDGLDGVVEASPELAVVWLKRCMQNHPLHIASLFEFAKAVYLGDGIPENLEEAVDLFLKTAHLGHAGAAYMLGECLLEGGVGVKRDRADALEWLVTAAELGHVMAQKRVLAVLKKNPDEMKDRTMINSDNSEKSKWGEKRRPTASGVNIERRHTLGPSPPAVLHRRLTKLAESQGASPPSPP